MVSITYILALICCIHRIISTGFECLITEIDILLFESVVCRNPMTLDTFESFNVEIKIENMQLLTIAGDLKEINITKADIEPKTKAKLENLFELPNKTPVSTTIIIPINFVAISLVDEKNSKIISAMFPLLKNKNIEKIELTTSTNTYHEHYFPKMSILYPSNNNGDYKYNFNIIKPSALINTFITATYKGDTDLQYTSKAFELFSSTPTDPLQAAANPIYLQFFKSYISSNSGSYKISYPSIVFNPILRWKVGESEIKVEGSQPSDSLIIDSLDYKIKHLLLNTNGEYIDVFITSSYLLRVSDISLNQISDPSKPEETNKLEPSIFANYNNLSTERVKCLETATILQTTGTDNIYKITTNKPNNAIGFFYKCFGEDNIYKEDLDEENIQIKIINGGFYYYRFPISELDEKSKLMLRLYINNNPLSNLLTNITENNNEWEFNNEINQKNKMNLMTNAQFILKETVKELNIKHMETITLTEKQTSINMKFTKVIIENLEKISITFNLTGSSNITRELKLSDKNSIYSKSIFTKIPSEDNGYKLKLCFDISELLLDKEVKIGTHLANEITLTKISISLKTDSSYKANAFLITTNTESGEIKNREIKYLANNIYDITLNHKIKLFDNQTETIIHALYYKTKLESNDEKNKTYINDQALAISKLDLNKNSHLLTKIIAKIKMITELDYLLLCETTNKKNCLFKYIISKRQIEPTAELNEDTNGLLFSTDSNFKTDFKLKKSVNGSKDLKKTLYLSIPEIKENDKNTNNKETLNNLEMFINQLTTINSTIIVNNDLNLTDSILFKPEFKINSTNISSIKNISFKNIALYDSKDSKTVIKSDLKSLLTYDSEGLFLQWTFSANDNFIMKTQTNLIYDCDLFNNAGSSPLKLKSYYTNESVSFKAKNFAPVCVNKEFNHIYSQQIEEFNDESFELNLKVDFSKNGSTTTASLTIFPSLLLMSDENLEKEKNSTDETPLQKVINTVKSIKIPKTKDGKRILFEAKSEDKQSGAIETPYLLVLSCDNFDNKFIGYPNLVGIDTKINLFGDSLRATIVPTDSSNSNKITFDGVGNLTSDIVGKNYNSILLKEMLIKNLNQNNSFVKFNVKIQDNARLTTYNLKFTPEILIKDMAIELNYKNEINITGTIETNTTDLNKIKEYKAIILTYVGNDMIAAVNKTNYKFELSLEVAEEEVDENKFEYHLNVNLKSIKNINLTNLIESNQRLEIKLKHGKMKWENTKFEVNTVIWNGTVNNIKIPISIGNIFIIIIFVLLLLLVFGITGLTIYLAYNKLIKMEQKRIKRRELEDSDYFFD